MPLYFFTAWLQGELAQFHLIWQSLLALVLIGFGALGASQGQWGLLLLLLSFAGLGYTLRQAGRTPDILDAALTKALGADYREQIPAARRAVLQDTISPREWMRPFSMRRDGVEHLADISYGQDARNRLDIYRPAVQGSGLAPVLLQIHGGGWTIGDKTEQGLPLMYHLAQRGWLCVAINYRLSPRHAFPAHIEDTKMAINWIKHNIGTYGGDPRFIAITGGSAGGHLAALAALTPNKAQYQPGFEQADTTLQAAVPFYGVYDWLPEPAAEANHSMHRFLVRHVLQCTPEENQQLWQGGSPAANTDAAAVPMFIVHGAHDSLVWVEEARRFAAKLAATSAAPVAYAELPGAQHAFEVFHSLRTDHTVNAVARFLEWSYARWQSKHAAQ
jgi:acetyl esterase/lipase